MKRKGIQQLITKFQEKEVFSRKELYDYFLQEEGELNEGTFGWRIHDLKEKDVLHETGVGYYTLHNMPGYRPEPDKQLIKLGIMLESLYQNAQYAIWNINWLNEFTLHQFSLDNIIIEIEKDLQESLRYTLLNKGYNVNWLTGRGQLQPLNVKNPIFIIPAISRMPVQKIPFGKGGSVSCPGLEKMLVDIFTDIKLFHFVQGAELGRIFENALTSYSINTSTLFSYAARRNKKVALRQFLQAQFAHLLPNLSYDKNALL